MSLSIGSLPLGSTASAEPTTGGEGDSMKSLSSSHHPRADPSALRLPSYYNSLKQTNIYLRFRLSICLPTLQVDSSP